MNNAVSENNDGIKMVFLGFMANLKFPASNSFERIGQFLHNQLYVGQVQGQYV